MFEILTTEISDGVAYVTIAIGSVSLALMLFKAYQFM